MTIGGQFLPGEDDNRIICVQMINTGSYCECSVF
jgi:hypothetical protein